jgi:hypothetical protein
VSVNNCNANNPCWCLCNYTPPLSPPCKKGKCLKLGYLLLKPENSVGPCGKTGKISLKCFDYSGCCGKDIVLEVVHNTHPEKLTVDSITKDELIFTTTEEAEPLDKITLTIKGSCCGLADYGQIVIFIKDLCECVTCTTGNTCNKCDAECYAVVGDLVLEVEEPLLTNNQSGLTII